MKKRNRTAVKRLPRPGVHPVGNEVIELRDLRVGRLENLVRNDKVNPLRARRGGETPTVHHELVLRHGIPDELLQVNLSVALLARDLQELLELRAERADLEEDGDDEDVVLVLVDEVHLHGVLPSVEEMLAEVVHVHVVHEVPLVFVHRRPALVLLRAQQLKVARRHLVLELRARWEFHERRAPATAPSSPAPG